jgi:hypothetical protein
MFSKNRISLLSPAAAAALVMGLSLTVGANAATSGNWSTYLNNRSRTGFNGAETRITGATASSLHPLWADSSGSVSAEPVQVNGTVYYGSWDGYERAAGAATGAQLWATYLGQTTRSTCNPPSVGVASTATVGNIKLNGVSTRAVFAGGGNHNLYMPLPARSSGNVRWAQLRALFCGVRRCSTTASFMKESPPLGTARWSGARSSRYGPQLVSSVTPCTPRPAAAPEPGSGGHPHWIPPLETSTSAPETAVPPALSRSRWQSSRPAHRCPC